MNEILLAKKSNFWIKLSGVQFNSYTRESNIGL